MSRQIIDIITDFLDFVGTGFKICTTTEPSFLPGLQLENGTIIIDPEKLLYPGDILHEAGHLATMPPDVRKILSGPLPDIEMHKAVEIMALVWSYAACLHIGLHARLVFYSEGYKDESDNIIENFTQGRYLGVPGLEWRGMAYTKKKAEELNALPYSNMINWLRKN